MSVFFCLPHAVVFSAFMICGDLYAFVAMMAVCVLNVSLGSSVTPKIVGCVFMGRYTLVLSSAASGVNNVQIVLSELSMRLLSFVQVCNCC